jgi:hypothetical protein
MTANLRVAIPSQSSPRLPNLQRIMIEFRNDICASMMGEAKSMSAKIPRTSGMIALVSAVLASGFFVSVPADTARAVDCLIAPNSSASQKDHWYYRTDRANQRKCWYLRAATQPSQQGAVQAAREAPPARSLHAVPAASPQSLASFKDFIAHQAGSNLSDKDVEKLYAQFLEWSRHAKN